jgi:hypothetical protein
VPPRQLGDLQQILRMLEATPAVHQHVESDNAEPDIVNIDSQSNESHDAQQPENRGHLQTARPPQYKPK